MTDLKPTQMFSPEFGAKVIKPITKGAVMTGISYAISGPTGGTFIRQGFPVMNYQISNNAATMAAGTGGFAIWEQVRKYRKCSKMARNRSTTMGASEEIAAASAVTGLGGTGIALVLQQGRLSNINPWNGIISIPLTEYVGEKVYNYWAPYIINPLLRKQRTGPTEGQNTWPSSN
jgi:hypothetical protein